MSDLIPCGVENPSHGAANGISALDLGGFFIFDHVGVKNIDLVHTPHLMHTCIENQCINALFVNA